MKSKQANKQSVIKAVLGEKKPERALQRRGMSAKTRVRDEAMCLDGSLGEHDLEPVAREKQGRGSS